MLFERLERKKISAEEFLQMAGSLSYFELQKLIELLLQRLPNEQPTIGQGHQH